MIVITAYSDGRGTYQVSINGRELGAFRTPLFSAARLLLEEGHSPDEPIGLLHQGRDTISMRSTIGAAASMSVAEDDGGTRFVPYRPGPAARCPASPPATARQQPQMAAG